MSIELQPRNNDGHLAHPGTRPPGTVTPQSGVIDSEGLFQAQFEASEFGGDVRIVATVGELTSGATIQVRVPNLSQVTVGDGYKMWGSKAVHPVGWYATSGMKTNLKNIGKAYKNKHDTDDNVDFENELLRYNDMSLIYGGKFDLKANWCTNCDHKEHRVGNQIDLGFEEVPAARRTELEKILKKNNGTIGPRYTNHWHVTF